MANLCRDLGQQCFALVDALFDDMEQTGIGVLDVCYIMSSAAGSCVRAQRPP